MTDNKQSKKISYYLPLLAMCCLAFWTVCMIAQDRLVSLPTGYVAAAIFSYPVVCAILDIIAEVYGYKTAIKTLWANLIMLFLIAVMLFSFAHLPAPPFMMTYEKDFDVAIHPVLWNISVAWISILVGQYINVYIISKLYVLTKGRYFALRSASSSIIGDTITFVLCIWGFFSNHLTEHQIIVITIDELVIMFGLAALLSIPASLIVAHLKKVEPGYNELLNIDIKDLP